MTTTTTPTTTPTATPTKTVYDWDAWECPPWMQGVSSATADKTLINIHTLSVDDVLPFLYHWYLLQNDLGTDLMDPMRQSRLDMIETGRIDRYRRFMTRTEGSQYRQVVESGREQIIVASNADTPLLGVVMLVPVVKSKQAPSGSHAELATIAVDRAWQNRGLGRYLLGIVACRLLDRGVRSMFTWSIAADARANSWYERQGATVVACREYRAGGLTVHWQERELAWLWPDLAAIAHVPGVSAYDAAFAHDGVRRFSPGEDDEGVCPCGDE